MREHENNNRTVDVVYDPITRKPVKISYIYRQIVYDHMAAFGEILIEQFDTGEQDYNVLMKNTILSFLEKYPHFKNDRLVYQLLVYILSIVRCRVFIHGNKYKMFSIYTVKAICSSYISPLAYQDAPEDFKLFMLQIRNSRNFISEELSIFYHNCAIIGNRVDAFGFLWQPTVDIDDAAFLTFNLHDLGSWAISMILQLVNDGLLVLNPGAIIVITAEQQKLLDEVHNQERNREYPTSFVNSADKMNKKK